MSAETDRGPDLKVRAADSHIEIFCPNPGAAGRLRDWYGPWVVSDPLAVAPLGRIVFSLDQREGTGVPDGGGGILLFEAGAFELALASEGAGDAGVERIDVRCDEETIRGAARVAARVLVSRGAAALGTLVLHASSVETPEGLLLFAGPSGSGKSAAAATFPVDSRVDPDVVMLRRRDGGWRREEIFDEYWPRRYAPGRAAGAAARAVLLPERGSRSASRRCAGRPPHGRASTCRSDTTATPPARRPSRTSSTSSRPSSPRCPWPACRGRSESPCRSCSGGQWPRRR